MTKARRKRKAKPPFVSFLAAHDHPGSVWNPRKRLPALKGTFQVNVFGTREHYLMLAEFIRELAERDTSDDAEYHEHFDGIVSADGKVTLNLILRKDDAGDSGCRIWYPKV